MNTLITLPSATELFARFQKIGADLTQLAADYLAAITAKPDFRTELLDAGFNAEQLNKLEALARGQMHPKLMLAVGTQYRALAKCPLSVQNEIIAHGVTVLEPDGTDTRLIPLDDLTPQQSRQVFHCGRIRNLTQQRSFLRESKRPRVTGSDVIVGKSSVKYQGITISKSQMLQWLAEMQ